MKRVYVPAIALLIALIVMSVSAQTKPKKDPAVRGEYIVTRVSMCVDCHTPMKDGKPDATRQLSGAPLTFKPIETAPHWMPAAPNLRSDGFLKGWTDAQLQTFLMTGKTPEGDMAHPPMPQYRLNKGDAAGVTAYLRSLKPVPAK